MFYKPFTMSKELTLLRFLHTKMALSAKGRQYYLNIEKGYEGEKEFSILLGNLTNEWIILHDLLLEVNNTKFQIDFLLISNKTIYLFEVKNYEGDYYIEDDIWYKIAKTEIKNPLQQLDRCKSLLRQLLQKLGFHYSIEPNIIFINPEFTLFQTPLHQPFILPTQLNRFMKKLNMMPTNVNEKHIKLAEKLTSLHIIDSPFSRLPEFNFEQLKKGINCAGCSSFMRVYSEHELICDGCRCKEKMESAILRNVVIFQLLFPNKKITTKAIYEWCGVIKSKRTIRRILSKNFTRVGHGKYSYYV